VRQNIVVGLDVGTTKICAIVAETKGGEISVLGAGVSPSTGLRKGMIINIDSTVESIQKAIKEAESSSGVRIKSVAVNISGAHIKDLHSTGAVGIKGKEITRRDVEHAVESAKVVYIPLDREVLHVAPTEFKLDGHEGITDPVGMSGVRLEVAVHIVTVTASALQNLLKCCEKAGLEVSDVVCEPLASAESVLTMDEKQFGSILVDIGGGTTGIALFKGGNIGHTSIFGVGGNHLTNDIAVGLRIPVPEAERLKRASGAAFAGPIAGPEEIKITHPGGQVRTLPRQHLIAILQPRCEEILELVKTEIKNCSGYESAVCGVILTGGGSLVNGFDAMAESVLGLPVRIGSPENVKGRKTAVGSPAFSTAVGLAFHQCEPETDAMEYPSVFGSMAGKVKNMVKDLFKYTDHLNLNKERKGA
jgi:cell division protein FtsA